MHGIVGRKLWETWDQMTWLLAEKDLNVMPVVTHTMAWDEFDRAFEIMRQGQSGKVVLDFSTAN